MVVGVGQSAATHKERVEIVCVDIGQGIPKRDIPIDYNKGKIRAGSYQIPFQCNLKKHLPSSLETSERGNSAGGKVEYVLRATLEGSGVFRDYRVAKEIQVVDQPKPIHRAVPYVMDPVHRDVCGSFGFNFRNQGELCIGAKILDKELVPGQKVILDLALRNNSLGAVKKVTVSLEQTVHIKTKGDFVKENNIKYTTEVIRKTFGLSEEVRKPLDKARLKQYKEDIESRREEDAESIRMELNQATPSRPLLLPPIPQDTMNHYDGCHIQISHQVRLKLDMEGGLKVSEFKLPVTVFPKDLSGPSSALWQAVEVSNREDVPEAAPIATPIWGLSDDIQFARAKVVSLED